MKWITAAALTAVLAMGVACGNEDATKSVEDATAVAKDAAQGAADDVASAAKEVAVSAVEACKAFAAKGDWDNALEVCKKAHEMMPDDLGLEHAYQQAEAAAK